MSDLDDVKALLSRLGVVFKEDGRDGEMYVDVNEGDGPRNTGYSGFLTRFEFDAEGKFLRMGAWE